MIDLVFPNVADFNVRHPSVRLPPAVSDGFIRESWAYADQAVFWSAEPRVLVLHPGYDPLWLADVHSALGTGLPPVVAPAAHSGLLGQDLLRDSAAMASLRSLVEGHDPVRLLAWGATPVLYQVAAVVRGWGHTVLFDGTAEEDYWASLYLDSKVSCLDLARDLPLLRVPPTSTVSTVDELRGALTALLTRCRRVIVRGMYGIEGLGSAITADAADPRFWSLLGSDPFLREFPLVVQEYIEHKTGVGCPAVDLYVTGDGVTRIVHSALTVDGSRLRGVCVGTSSLPVHHAAQAAEAGQAIGLTARDLGFRGWLGVDFVLDRDGRLYATEINARRTGAMHAISLLDRWNEDLQVHFTTRLAVRAESYRDDLRSRFERLWSDGVHAYPTTVRAVGGRSPTIGVLTAADTVMAAESISSTIRSGEPLAAR